MLVEALLVYGSIHSESRAQRRSVCYRLSSRLLLNFIVMNRIDLDWIADELLMFIRCWNQPMADYLFNDDLSCYIIAVADARVTSA